MRTSKLWAVIVAVVMLAVAAEAQSYPSVVQLSPATAAQPCSVGVAAKNGTIAICPKAGSPNIITIDFGDGKDYVNPFTATVGPAGPPGPAGPAGPTGPAGAKGATGATGAAGADGPAGIAGATGATGPAGPAGTMPANFTCTGPNSISSTGVWTLSGCK